MWGRCGTALLWGLLGLTACAPGEPEGPTPGRPRFDGEAAYRLVERQVAFGPRVPGTQGHAAQLAWMTARLDSLGAEVTVDSFTHRTAAGTELDLRNVLARFQPEAPRRILLLAHWDTRPWADEAPDPGDRETPVPGANDGGSGTAVLLQVAEHLAEQPAPMGVDILLVDGEDYGPGIEDMLLGSRHYAANLDPLRRPVYAVLLDMVGDADPYFPVEGYSAEYARAVVSKYTRAARRLGYQDVFPTTVGDRVNDDHVPLLQAGVPAVDIIDFEYGPGNRYWHTLEDTPDRVRASTLEMVGEVVLELLYSGG